MNEIIEQVLAHGRAIEDIQIRLHNMLRVGPITDRDPVKGYRIDMGPDTEGGPVKSAWLPHPESGGEARTWMPLSGGQIMAMLSPGGDLEQAFLMRAGFGGGIDPPSQDHGEVVLIDFGSIRISVTANGIVLKAGTDVITIGNGEIKLTSNLVQATGASLKHNAKEVGDTHAHGGVTPGSSPTQAPV